jgi:hypothetical protein
MTCDGYVDGEWYEHQGAVPRSTVLANMVAAIQREHVEEPKPWPFPTGKAPEKQPEPEKEMPPPLAASNGLLIEQAGRYASGLGFNGEE